MKKTLLKKWLVLVAFVVFAVALAGCANFERAVYDKVPVVIPASTNAQTFVGYSTNAAGVVTAATNTRPVVIPAHVEERIEPKAAATGLIDLVKAAPVPYAGTAGALLAALIGGYARVRNTGKVSTALVKGIEAFRVWVRATPEGIAADARLLDYLKQHQEAAGVLNEVAALVNEHTGDTVQ